MPAEPRPRAREAHRDVALGGQALVDGVMMRGRSSWALAVRAPEGGIVVRSFPSASRVRRATTPVLRGTVAVAESLALGARALALAGRRAWVAPVALALGAGLFLLAPAALAALLSGSALLEGVLRVAVVLAGLAVLAGVPALRPLFAYHGAEHKAVACLEAGLPLTPDAARGCSRLHPRCGTTFLLVLTVVAGVVYAPLGLGPWYLVLTARVLLAPLAVGLAFELVRWAAADGQSRWARMLTAPGMQLQRLTTREPEHAQLAVALAALRAVLAVEDPVRARAATPTLAAR